MDQYDDQKFMRLRRFAPSLADTKEKHMEKFMLGLNPKTRRMLEAFNPKTYEEALRTAKTWRNLWRRKTQSQRLSQEINVLPRSDPQNPNRRSRDLDIRTGHLLHPQ